MVDYLYDGTFEGFLTCIHAHYYEEKAAGIYRKECYQASLLSGCKTIETEERQASTVYEAIEKKISRDDLRRIYRVFQSSDGEKENKLLRYIILGFREGPEISLLHSNPVVFDVQKCEQKVFCEVHRILGLARFSALKYGGADRYGEAGCCDATADRDPVAGGPEILYCRIEPDHDILEFIAGHFSDRLRNEPFIIHDKTRSKAIFARDGDWYISAFNGKGLPLSGAGEREYSDLWRMYFETIAIQERINPACQKRFMPVRYWKNLTEIR
ncbi:MAG TPA: TIGR03915 family putative DNA repair protein [Anaerovoracaceae bacterium]|nr:TIGR03915 family putative DNA repair protein [Anaerovoracaceae bacterium]